MRVEVLFDARALGEYSSFRGIGTYERNLLAHAAADGRVRLTALATDSTDLPPGVGRARMVRRAPGRLAPFEHEILLDRDMRRAGGDVFHSPAQDPPRRARMPWVQTIHDVIPLVDPATAPAIRRRFIRHAGRYRSANLVLTDSRHAADDCVRRLEIDPRRIRVAPLGVDPVFCPGAASPAVDPPYLLFVGEHEPRKRLDHALEVVGRLADAGFPHRLEIAGTVAPWVEEGLMATVRASRRPDRVDVLGFVKDLPALYRGATALVFPSRYEGFGLPALEAMASGVPVVGYANSSLPEVVGSGGVLVHDGDVEALSEATRSIVTDLDRRADLAAAALEAAGHFTWEACARAHADAYLEAAG